MTLTRVWCLVSAHPLTMLLVCPLAMGGAWSVDGCWENVNCKHSYAFTTNSKLHCSSQTSIVSQSCVWRVLIDDYLFVFQAFACLFRLINCIFALISGVRGVAWPAGPPRRCGLRAVRLMSELSHKSSQDNLTGTHLPGTQRNRPDYTHFSQILLVITLVTCKREEFRLLARCQADKISHSLF